MNALALVYLIFAGVFAAHVGWYLRQRDYISAAGAASVCGMAMACVYFLWLI